ncbi:amino acid permease [Flavobacterium sp. I3-2]|uniref:amino acid permease n=1 Tax=Flavobacterium sp. I3-2 TaxID=2748319 RepID=UPI0015ABE5C5|nr:amino acid permease [Flavobacterium sp. I3-2]
MIYVYTFLVGLFASIVGTILPGLLNGNIVKIAAKEGRKKAYIFTSGVLVVIFFQTYLAINFARLIDRSDFVAEIIHEVGLAIFAILTIYFLFFAKRPKEIKVKKEKSAKRRFFYGMFLAAINMFPIPYYVFVSITADQYLDFELRNPFTSLISLGVVFGSAFVFMLYLNYFKNKSLEENYILKNINYFIGGITGIIAIFTAIKIFY